MDIQRPAQDRTKENMKNAETGRDASMKISGENGPPPGNRPPPPPAPPPITPHPGPLPASAEREKKRRRAYSPRISKKGDKGGLVKQKELELRDARMLGRSIEEIKDLSPWGLGELKNAIKDLGPVQPGLELPGKG